MIKRLIVGGVVTLFLGGTGYTISQSDVTKNFANESGMTQEQAESYVNDAQKDLESFTKIGTDLTAEGNDILTKATTMDCENYMYDWESTDLSCNEGKVELQTIGNNEVALGKCYAALGTDLKTESKSKLNECIVDIETTNASYDLPISAKILSSSEIAELKNANTYNKSVFLTALQSN